MVGWGMVAQGRRRAYRAKTKRTSARANAKQKPWAKLSRCRTALPRRARQAPMKPPHIPHIMYKSSTTSLPTEAEITLAKDSSRLLALYLSSQEQTQAVRVIDQHGEHEAVQVPTAASDF